MATPTTFANAVERLSEASGYKFLVTAPLPNTNLYVVYTENHPFPERYTVRQGGLGFRVPGNLPDAQPEDNFFITPPTIKLAVANPERNSIDINRASPTDGIIPSSILGGGQVLVFSWHIWDRVPWRPRTNTLIDHYTHCLRRFEAPEHG